jgi:hypothetical protein
MESQNYILKYRHPTRNGITKTIRNMNKPMRNGTTIILSNMAKPMRKFHPETKKNAFFMLTVNSYKIGQ